MRIPRLETWQPQTIKALAEEALKRGLRKFDRVFYENMIFELAEIDQQKRLSERTGFWVLRKHYNSVGLARLFPKMRVVFEETASAQGIELEEEYSNAHPTYVGTLPKNLDPLTQVFRSSPVQTVLQLTLDKDGYGPQELAKYFEKYVSDYLRTIGISDKVSFTDAAKASGMRYEFKISHAIPISRITSYFRLAAGWVFEVRIIPAKLFGKNSQRLEKTAGYI